MNYESFFSEYFPFWDKLNEAQKRALCEDTAEISYPKGHVVHDPNECTGAIILKSGGLRTYFLSEDGKEVTLFRLYAGDICILSATCVLRAITFDVMVEADADCECLLIGSRTLGKLVEECIYVKNYALEITASHFSETMWSFEQILFMSFEKRLAIFLLDECARRHSDTLKLTHEQIAKYMGSAREVVTRMLRTFSSEGIVESGRGGVHVIDKARLRKYL
jgi:CRP/FNR family transcriptional regulator